MFGHSLHCIPQLPDGVAITLGEHGGHEQPFKPEHAWKWKIEIAAVDDAAHGVPARD